MTSVWGLGQHSLYSNSLQAEQSRVQIPVQAIFSIPIQIVPGAYWTIDTGFLYWRYSRSSQGMALTPPPRINCKTKCLTFHITWHECDVTGYYTNKICFNSCTYQAEAQLLICSSPETMYGKSKAVFIKVIFQFHVKQKHGAMHQLTFYLTEIRHKSLESGT
jgi:hypothetical protein